MSNDIDFGVSVPLDFAVAKDGVVGELCIELRPRADDTLGDPGADECAVSRTPVSKLVL
jgi:hypothetical protein